MTHVRCAALALLVSVFGPGCSDLFLVELGRDQVGQVRVDRTFPTGLHELDGCPPLHLAFGKEGSASGDVVVAPLSAGCLLSVRLEEAELLNAPTMRAWAEALKGYDMSALIAIDIIVDELSLDAGHRSPLGERDVYSLSIALEDRVLVDQDDLAMLGTDELRMTIPQRLVDGFLEALENGHAFTGTLDLRMVLREGVDIPPVLRLRTLLQPVLLVDGWKATF